MTERRTAFVGVHLTVNNLAKSADFYRMVGLKLPADTDLGEHVEIDLGGGAQLALSTERVARMYDPGFREPFGQTASALQFQVNSRQGVDDLYRSLTGSGYAGHLAPVEAFWGGRYAEVDDPDGNIIGLHGSDDPS
jgi:uncharacterized glyoxalase superfamily protein PhnB